MTDKKYTDKDIISSLEVIATTSNCNECKIRNCKWGTCNCSQITANAALELINRQESEIERLKKDVSVARDAYIAIQDRYEHAKTEAYKAFAENAVIRLTNNYHSEYAHWIDDTIYSLLKEMVGEEE